MRKQRIDDACLQRHAGEFAQIIPQLGVADTNEFWTKIRSWTVGELQTAIDAFRETGTIDLFRAMLERPPPVYVPRGYWMDFDNVARELRIIEAELGHFPNGTELQKINQYGLLFAINKYYGGMFAVRTRLGVDQPARKPPGYWSDLANVDVALIRAYDRIGRCPTTDDLKGLENAGLLSAIQHRHGGLHQCLARLGLTPKGRPSGYWQDRANIERELRIVMDDIGYFPVSLAELKTRGLHGLAEAISNEGGLDELRERMGATPPSTSVAFWTEDRVMAAVRALADKLGYMPTGDELIEHGLPIVRQLIRRVYGGQKAVRERLGLAEKPLPQDPWLDRKYFARELRAFVEQLGRFPTAEDCALHEKIRLHYAISRFYGGFRRVQDEFLAGTARKISQDPITDWTQAECVLREQMAVLGHFPTKKELNDAGYWRVMKFIQEHGGLVAARSRLGFRPITDELIAEHAATLARAIPALHPSDTEQLWSALKSRWVECDLKAAIVAFETDGSLERFEKLLDVPSALAG